MAHSELGSVTAVTGVRGVAERDEVLPARTIHRRPGLPGGRALVGALLMSLAAVGVFLAYSGANEAPSDALVVATRAIRVGDEITGDDVRVVRAELPGSTKETTFATTDDVLGRVALGPIDEGEIVQAGAVTADRPVDGGHEVALTLPREQLAVGRLKAGERVDVFVTYEERTTSVARGAEVVQIATSSDGSLTSDREVSVVVAVSSGEVVAAIVHALRTGDVTVVRSTFAAPDEGEPLVYEPGTPTEHGRVTTTGGAGG
jgi:Flp pilus assembly protein CpaB